MAIDPGPHILLTIAHYTPDDTGTLVLKGAEHTLDVVDDCWTIIPGSQGRRLSEADYKKLRNAEATMLQGFFTHGGQTYELVDRDGWAIAEPLPPKQRQ